MIEPDEGQVIKNYVLKSRIGTGAFANIYRAHQRVIERDVAIKIIHPQFANNPDFVRRFEVEAQTVAWLEHPHIVPLYDYWREPNGAYLVMRWLRGGSLRERLQESPLPLESIARILDQITAALATAHRNGIVHQDIKPDNLLLDTEGNAYLSDFGIARPVVGSRDKTGKEIRYGSPAYASPETFMGEPITQQSDIYSLGIMLYEFLTGTLPFAAPNPTELMEQHVAAPMPSVRSVNASLSTAFDELIWKTTAKHPDARFTEAPLIAAEFRWIISSEQKQTALPSEAVVQSAMHPSGGSLATVDLGLSPQPRNPFKGLRAFEEADMADFFGRDALISKLLKALDNSEKSGRFLAVVGPSGSGKSSVVKAGLIPALRRSALKNSERWFITMMVPGTEPIQELQAALLKVAVNTPDLTLGEGDSDQLGLAPFLKEMLQENDSELLLVIDQFEEIFTLVESEEVRSKFLNGLHQAITELKGRFGVVITLRADYYHRPLLYSGFGELISANTEVVLPMTPSELAQVITEPARQSNVLISDELVATVVADVSQQPGALPLLEYTLTELFERRERNTISLADYRAGGGVTGTLARRANELYEDLESDHLKQVARKLFLSLVAVGVDTDATRRRVRQSDALLLEKDKQAVFELLDTFGKHRLLTFDREPVSRTPTVEIAHEALISQWDRLREWIETSRDDLRARSRLSVATEEWNRENREPSFLASGERLAQFEGLASRETLLLTDDEATYLQSSIALRQRNIVRLRLFIASLVVLTVLAVGAAIFAFDRQSRAESERDRADIQAQIARSRELAVTALTNLEEELDLALLLSVEAYRISEIYESRSSLMTALQQEPRLLTFLHGHSDAARAVAFSPDGRYVASGGRDLHIRIWDTITYELLLAPLEGHTGQINSVAFSPDGAILASGSADGTVRLWEIASGEEVTSALSGDQDAVWSVAFSPDGRRLASAGEDGSIIMWNLATYRRVGQPLVGHQDIVYSVAFSPDGEFLASGSSDETVRVWNARTRNPVGEPFVGHSNWVLTLAFSPDSQLLASSGADNTVILWDPGSGDEIFQFPTNHTDWIWSIAFGSDGFSLVTGSADNTIRVWDLPSGTPRSDALNAHQEAVWSIAADPSGTRIASASADHKVILWELSQTSPLETSLMQQQLAVLDLALHPDNNQLVSADGDMSGSTLDSNITIWDFEAGRAVQEWPQQVSAITSVDFSPDGTIVAAAGADNNITLWDAETGELLSQPLDGHTDVVWSLNFSPDGQLLASASDDGSVILWNRSSGWASVMALEGHTEGLLAVAFSPDGTMLASGGRDTTIRLWNVETGQPVGEPLNGHLDAVTNLVFNLDGTMLVSGSRDRTLIAWDVATGTPLGEPLARHDHWVLGLAFSPDGQLLASGGRDGRIVLWDTATMQPLGSISINQRGWVNSVLFNTTGQRLYSGHQDGSIIGWNTNPEVWAELACRAAGRDLSPEEQRSYLGDTPKPVLQTGC